MPARNYQKELDQIIDGLHGVRPKLLLHACCAPCSSYCLEYLREYFDITVFFYNPNISEPEEFEKRLAEEKRLIKEFNSRPGENSGPIDLIAPEHHPEMFFDTVYGYEDCAEGGDRCGLCFTLRLERAFAEAEKIGADYVTTTLTISPLKNAERINSIGEKIEAGSKAFGGTVLWLPSDFKKKDGYKRSIELSEEFGLYRQNYCGCVFSKRNGPDSEEKQ